MYTYKPTLYLLKGAPAGKKKKARVSEMLMVNPRLIYISKSGLIKMLFLGEPLVARDCSDDMVETLLGRLISSSLRSGYDILLDNPDVFPYMVGWLRDVALELDASFQEIDLK